MPITFREAYASPTGARGQSKNWDVLYIADGDSDPTAILDDAELADPSGLPDEYDGCKRESVAIQQKLYATMWLVLARYKSTEKEPGEWTRGFDTTGGQVHITHSLGNRGRTTADLAFGEPPDMQGAIGFTESGIEGTDIIVPKLEKFETHKIAAATVTDAYEKTLASLTGTVNLNAFRGFAAEEVLFLGASGQQAGPTEDYEISFRFSCSQNLDTFQLDWMADSLVKKGHDFFFVIHQKKAGDKGLFVVPKWAYVEKIYEPKSWAAMGI